MKHEYIGLQLDVDSSLEAHSSHLLSTPSEKNNEFIEVNCWMEWSKSVLREHILVFNSPAQFEDAIEFSR
jgi:hypothetical protein